MKHQPIEMILPPVSGWRNRIASAVVFFRVGIQLMRGGESRITFANNFYTTEDEYNALTGGQ